jgi:hypothetical protein
MIIKYSSNNSGGGWWLHDEDWKKLEDAGWNVDWVNKDSFLSQKVKGKDEYRWLGALAKEAEKEFDSVKDAILEFETITGKSTMEEGCNCCGPPHTFTWEDKDGNFSYAEGESIAEILYGCRFSYKELLEERYQES